MTEDIHVSAAVIVDSGGRVLFVRKRGTEVFMQPGGKPRAGEDAGSTLIRELREELGLCIPLDALRPLGRFAAPAANEPGRTVVADAFAIDARDLAPEIGAEIVELRWVAESEAPSLRLAPLSRTHLLPLVWG